MNCKTFVHIGLFILLIACSNQSKDSIIMNYEDFGPQSLSWKHIGMEWWQWQPHGDSNPQTKYEIKVVIYRNYSLEDVQKKYPVNKKKNQDYRYIEYSTALRFLDKNIKENVIPETTTRLKQTKNNILKSLKE